MPKTWTSPVNILCEYEFQLVGDESGIYLVYPLAHKWESKPRCEIKEFLVPGNRILA